MKMRLIALLVITPLLLSPQFSTSTSVASEQGTPCGIYKNSKNEVIAGVKFPKGDYQIYTYGMPCNKVLGKKGILATFLKQKDKDPLPKPWRYVSDTVGAQGFSASGVGFRVQLITKNPQGSNPSQSPKKTSTTTLGSAEQLIAYENMKKSMIPKSAGQLFRFHYSPNAVQSYIKFLESDLPSAMSYWTSVYTNKELFNVFYGTELDLDWLIGAWRPYGFDSNKGFAEDFRGRIEREGTRLQAGAVPSQSGSSHLSILRHSSLPTTPNTFIPHEGVHIVQQFLTKNKTGEMPCWLREGSAELFGFFISNEMYGRGGGDWYNGGKQGAMNIYLGGTSGIELRNFNKDEWFTHLKSLEGNFSGNCGHSGFAYGIGLLLSELLMAEGGFDKMMEFWRAFSLEEDWRKSFKNIYGVEIDIWYKTKGVPYLIREYVRVPKY